MKGSYNSCTMSIYGSIIPGAATLAKIKDISSQARQRLKWFDYYELHDHNARLTCRYFGISPQTFYRWKRRYKPRDLSSLEERSRKPKNLRRLTAPAELIGAVFKLREEYPRWGKDKLVVLVHRQSREVSTSMVGRILKHLKNRGVLKEPICNYISAKKRRWQRPASSQFQGRGATPLARAWRNQK